MIEGCSLKTTKLQICMFDRRAFTCSTSLCVEYFYYSVVILASDSHHALVNGATFANLQVHRNLFSHPNSASSR